jgi:hypothetical protein
MPVSSRAGQQPCWSAAMPVISCAGQQLCRSAADGAVHGTCVLAVGVVGDAVVVRFRRQLEIAGCRATDVSVVKTEKINLFLGCIGTLTNFINGMFLTLKILN